MTPILVTNFGPELPLLLKLYKFGQLIFRKVIEIVATLQISNFMAKMHQIRFRLGLHPRARWGSLRAARSPRLPSWI